jgi:hypothetical protein
MIKSVSLDVDREGPLGVFAERVTNKRRYPVWQESPVSRRLAMIASAAARTAPSPASDVEITRRECPRICVCMSELESHAYYYQQEQVL